MRKMQSFNENMVGKFLDLGVCMKTIFFFGTGKFI